jgi:hypothetical protein
MPGVIKHAIMGYACRRPMWMRAARRHTCEIPIAHQNYVVDRTSVHVTRHEKIGSFSVQGVDGGEWPRKPAAYVGVSTGKIIRREHAMAAMKPRTGDGPLEVTKEGRGIVMRVPLEGGGRLVVEMSAEEASALGDALKGAAG